MSTQRLSRGHLFSVIVVAWLASVVWLFISGPGPGQPRSPQNTVIVTHWANGHPMNKNLLPRFAEQFNKAGYKTSSGKRIEVRFPMDEAGKNKAVNSGTITAELIARVGRGATLNRALPNPTIVTPAADHWFGDINYATGRTVIDRANALPLATTYIGIVTLREMAECLGWPRKEVGIADVVALRVDPRGWESCPKAKIEWGKRPLISYTDPNTSSTGRSMLFALYSIAAGKTVDQLSPADVARPELAAYVKTFQSAVDHYVYDTLTLNSKIYLGPRYGHFFFVSESNLVQLYQGKLAVTVEGVEKPLPLSRDMVMIYPREGSAQHNHSAGIVQADWVTPEQVEAAQQWIAFVREEPQQRAFMEEGYRPATDISVECPICGRFGLDSARPALLLQPDAIDPAATEAIIQSWPEIKKPGVVTFVVDVSISMAGAKFEETKKGLKLVLDSMAKGNGVGLLAFGDDIYARVPVAPLTENRFELARAVDNLSLKGATALYDAIRTGIAMTDAAEAAPDAARGVVVITDGRANRGTACLHDIIEMTSSRNEKAIRQFCGFEGDEEAREEGGQLVNKRDVFGTALAIKTRNPVHVFFVGVGKDDVDLQVCRIVAEATHSACQSTTEKALKDVIEAFGRSF